MPEQLNERATLLLKKLVYSYIADGQPVGSKKLADDADAWRSKERDLQVGELGLEVDVESVMDPEHLSELHALSLPQLVVNGHHNAEKTSMTLTEIKAYLSTFDS